MPPGWNGMPWRRAMAPPDLILLTTSTPPGMASKIRRPISKPAPPAAAPTPIGTAVRTASDRLPLCKGMTFRVPKTNGTCALRVLPANRPIPGRLDIFCLRTVSALRPSALRATFRVTALMPPPGPKRSMPARAKRPAVALVTIALAAVRSSRLRPARACFLVTCARPDCRILACLALLRDLLLAIYSTSYPLPNAIVLFPDSVRDVSL